MLRRHLILALVAALACGAATAAEPGSRPVTVFAAASLTDVLGKLGDEFTKSTAVQVRFSFAASSILARQIAAGAGADVFVSADQEWMDYLEQRGHIRKASRHNLLGNRLALIAPADSKIELKIEPGFALASALGNGRLATGDPDNVPVGRYARSALTTSAYGTTSRTGWCAPKTCGTRSCSSLAVKCRSASSTKPMPASTSACAWSACSRQSRTCRSPTPWH